MNAAVATSLRTVEVRLRATTGPHHSRGAALIAALLFLVVLTLLALSGARITLGAVHSSLNQVLRVDALLAAQSVVDGVIAVPSNTPVTTGTGQTWCTAGCASPTIVLPGGLLSAEIGAGIVVARATRLEPEFAPPPRGAGASLSRFYAASFRVEGSYDATEAGQGRAQVNEGLILLLPRSS